MTDCNYQYPGDVKKVNNIDNKAHVWRILLNIHHMNLSVEVLIKKEKELYFRHDSEVLASVLQGDFEDMFRVNE